MLWKISKPTKECNLKSRSLSTLNIILILFATQNAAVTKMFFLDFTDFFEGCAQLISKTHQTSRFVLPRRETLEETLPHTHPVSHGQLNALHIIYLYKQPTLLGSIGPILIIYPPTNSSTPNLRLKECLSSSTEYQLIISRG